VNFIFWSNWSFEEAAVEIEGLSVTPQYLYPPSDFLRLYENLSVLFLHVSCQTMWSKSFKIAGIASKLSFNYFEQKKTQI